MEPMPGTKIFFSQTPLKFKIMIKILRSLLELCQAYRPSPVKYKLHQT